MPEETTTLAQDFTEINDCTELSADSLENEEEL